jgi:CheY-like chemotaxis protein
MGGEIGVDSAIGSGSRFWFEIPLSPATNPTIERRSLPGRLAGLHVLIVDDVEMNRRILARQLEGFGVEVVSAGDGFAAMAELERAFHLGKPFDLVIIDQLMPDLSGEVLAQKMRATPGLAETKMVIASSAGPNSLAKATPGVIDAVLTKPVREQSLLDAFAQLFGSPGQQRLEARPSPSPSPRPAIRPLRILLAEDNKINQQLVTLLLRKAAHQVEVAENGELAVEAVRNGEYDVVLMDVQMPILDGVQATKRIRALPPPKNAVPIIALTAHAMAGAREEYLAAEMDDYLTKPIDELELLSRLNEVADGAIGRASTVALAAPGCCPRAALDLARLEMVAEVMADEELDEFIDVFVASAAERINKIQGLDSDNLDVIGQEAHTLLGTAANLGALQLGKLAGELRAACDASDHALAKTLTQELGEALNSTSAAVLAWMHERRGARAA